MSGRWLSVMASCLTAFGLVLAMGLTAAPVEAKTSKSQKRQAAEPAAKRGSKQALKAKSLADGPQARGGKTLTSAKSKTVLTTKVVNGKRVRMAVPRAALLVPAVASVGMQSGLHAIGDPLELKSGVALVIDQDNQEVLFSKNSGAVLPIASITKLMTALVVMESGLPLSETLSIEQDDVEQTSLSRSRLASGTSMSRAEMLRLALMSSENRAAHALSRHYPGGSQAFVAAMNRKASQLGMNDTRFVEATGLSAENRSSAMDLARLVSAASAHDIIRDFSTSRESLVAVGSDDRMVHFKSTNGLIGNPDWDISLQKTGYIAAAGRCLVMQAQLAGRRLIMVLLDSAGSYSRFGDAERIRKWLTAENLAVSQGQLKPAAALTR